MADTTLGFKFRFRRSRAPETYQQLLFSGSEDLTKGDLVNLESGEVDLAVTTDTALLGIVTETKTGVDSTTFIEVLVDEDAVYGVYDPNVRLKGATLDIAGATGNMTVASSSNKELVVFAPSAADEETLVRFNIGKHHENLAL